MKTTEATSKAGVIVALIDGMMATASVLLPLINKNKTYFIQGSPVYEALKDLHENEDILGLLKIGPPNPSVLTAEDTKIHEAIRNSHKMMVEKGLIPKT